VTDQIRTAQRKARSDFSITILGTLLLLSAGGRSYVQPKYLFEVQEHYGLLVSQLGLISGLESLAAGIGCILAGVFQRHANERIIIAFSAVCVLGSVASLFARDFQSIIAIRTLVGLLGEGPLVAIAYRTLGSAPNPERALAIATTMLGVAGALILWIEKPLIQTFGPGAILLPFGMVAAVSVAWMLRERSPSGIRPLVSAQRVVFQLGQGSLKPGLLILASAVLLSGAASGMWTFTATAAGASGANSEVIAHALSVGIVFGLGGSLIPAVLGARFGRILPITLCSVGIIASGVLVGLNGSFLSIAIASMVLQICWGTNSVYLISGLVSRDIGGRLVPFAAIAQIAGAAFSASIFAWFIKAFGYHNMPYAVAAGALPGILIFVLGMKWREENEQDLFGPAISSPLMVDYPLAQ